MPTDVIMPQMGESIFEGTITKWLKQAGDAVEKDEPLFEISTDKVDAEIPSPVAGVLQEIKVFEGETVQINTVVAVVAEGSAEQKSVPKASPTNQAPARQESPTPARKAQPAQLAPPQVVQVVMPQMGESIFEGTITKWLKKAGESVQKDEPLFEISTDKVDAEIPSPVTGVLTEIKIGEGETVDINTVVAVIGSDTSSAVDSVFIAKAIAQPDGSPTTAPPPTSTAPPGTSAPATPAPPAQLTPPQGAHLAAVRSSPLVRRMAREHKLDMRRIAGSGSSGRITKDDVLLFMKNGGATATPMTQAADQQAPAPPAQSAPPQVEQVVVGDRLEPLSRMRGIIAQRMAESRRTSPHAYSVYKVDMTSVVRLRERSKASFEQRHGVKLTYMPFIAAAAIDALRRYPIVNASLEGNAVRYHQNIHLGVAVALEWGLIVPVIREAERRTFRDLAAAIADLAERARSKKLKPEEASGSTFTLTNSGVFGGEYGTPIINQPESAILAIGGLRKEPAVLTDAEGNDSIAIRSMQQYCLGFDHRTIDGADAGRFMTAFKDALEKWNSPIE
jgi:pyruvate dehydrogenase E2 component (dihydrolipoamide acetyltransferase)